MTTRVVGRGKCPKCGMEGSVVLKDIYNKVYVYIKHGRKWCYVGPLESTDLASIVTSLSDYHYFTTKINEYTRRILGFNNMKVSLLVFASVFSIAIAYVASVSYGYPYEVWVATALISQFFTVIAVFTALLAIALYEVRYKCRFELRIPFVTGNPVLGLLFAILATLAAIVVFQPMRSHVEDYVVGIATEVRDHMIVRDIIIRFSLPCILLSSLVLAVVSKGLFNRLRWSAVALFISPFVALLIMFIVALSTAGELTTEALAYLAAPIKMLGSRMALLAILYIAGLSVFKKFLLLEQVQ